jgi:nucleoside-diphosphate-sugar epimerase
MNIKKAEKCLGWTPKYGREEGLKKSYDWWEQFLKTKTL